MSRYDQYSDEELIFRLRQTGQQQKLMRNAPHPDV